MHRRYIHKYNAKKYFTGGKSLFVKSDIQSIAIPFTQNIPLQKDDTFI